MSGMSGNPARETMLAWIAYAQTVSDWNFGKVWSAEDGWKVVWVVGDKGLGMNPAFARKWCRDLRQAAEAKFRTMSADDLARVQAQTIRDLFDHWDEEAKDCLHLSRVGAVPRAAGGTYDEPVVVQ